MKALSIAVTCCLGVFGARCGWAGMQGNQDRAPYANVIPGWTCDPTQPTLPVIIKMVWDGATNPNTDYMSANQPRSDLGGVCGGNIDHSFYYVADPQIRGNGGHSVNVLGTVLGDSQYQGPYYQLTNAPQAVPANLVVGYITGATNGTVSGWACDPDVSNDPNAQVTVEVWDDLRE